MTAIHSVPVRHPAPAGEVRLEYPGKCWVWACSDAAWSFAFEGAAFDASSDGRILDCGWYVIRTRGPNPPWPHFLSQRDPQDETP